MADGEDARGEIVLEGEVERVTFENASSNFRVVKIAVEGRADRLAVVGTFPPVSAGVRVRVRGRLVHDKKHGDQLQASSVTELAPSTLVGIERYLGSGLVKGVGETYARRIVARFGLETLHVLEDAPHRLVEVEGLGKKRIERIVASWMDHRAVREVMVFLQAHGASPALATRILKRYGTGAVNVVSREPYRLANDVWGIGFKTADRIAAELGIAKDSPQRLQAGILQTLRDAREAGHVYAPNDDLMVRAASMLGLDAADVGAREALAHGVRALALGGYVVVDDTPDGRIVYAAEMHAAEGRLAARLVELSGASAAPLGGAGEAIAAFERDGGVELAREQREAVERAADAPLLVITGGPGVGKTTIVRAILAVLDRAGLSVRLAAPTGRAAKRMTEATGREASTLHRLLDFDPKTAGFKRDRNRPIEASAVIVDEASMIDVEMGDALAQAIDPGTRLVLVGDVDQLPSVGPGAVLRDVIASGEVPTVRLTRIFRQARESLIVTNAHRINHGEAPVTASPGDDRADFFMIERRDPELAKKTIVEVVTSRIPKRFGLDPVRDVQVLTPMHRGPCGSIALNAALQAELNPHGPEVTHGARVFRAGDKVMQLRNDYDRNVWNGDLGIITSVDPEEGTVVVGFDEKPPAPPERSVPYDRGALDELTLAYACTVHKSQGSEYPAVVIPFLTTHFVMLSRNLLYTAVTRGKRLVVLVSDPRAVALALAATDRSSGGAEGGAGEGSPRKTERRTRLAHRIVASALTQRGRLATL